MTSTTVSNPAPRPRRQRTRFGSLAQLRAGERRSIDKALEIIASYMSGPGDVFSSPAAIMKYACLRLGTLPHEVFGMVCLDAQNRMIEYHALFRGTLTQTAVYPREVVLCALGNNAASVILMHNHPSGTVQPSRADLALTETLNAALSLVDVRVLDHIIVGGAEALSMAERGLL
jgi:DNA repair protein RadC